MIATQGEEVKKRVREFFNKGHKTGNKMYHVDLHGNPDNSVALTAIEIDKVNRRDAHVSESASHRLPGGASRYDQCEQLIKMPVTDRSGNCDEMAGLSAYYANKHYSINRECLYIGEISGNGDHVFCLATSQVISTSNLKRFASVSEFTKAKVAANWLIIDPWLNLVCKANDYLRLGGKKLDDWGACGKRISWHAGTQGPGWYNPDGEYKVEFGNAPVQLVAF